MPTFSYLKDQFGFIRDVLGMVWQNEFLKDFNSRASIAKLVSPVKSKVFAGEGYNTIETLRVLYPNLDNLFGKPGLPYPDGQPIPLLEGKNVLGDKTVLSQKSAKITEVNVPLETKSRISTDPENFLEHSNLPNSFFNEILLFLGGPTSTLPLYLPSLPKEILVISLASPADLLIIDPQGRKLGFDFQAQGEKYEISGGIYSGRDNLELAAIIDPKIGEYKVTVFGNGEGDFSTGMSYIKDGCDDSVDQDNFGQIHSGTILTFAIDLKGGCGVEAISYTLDSTIDIDPDTLNIASKGKYITTYIELPNLYKVEDIDVTKIKLNEEVPAFIFPSFIGDHDEDGIKDLMVKFDRRKVQQLTSLGDNRLSISGQLNDGTRFAGKDIVKVVNSSYDKILESVNRF